MRRTRTTVLSAGFVATAAACAAIAAGSVSGPGDGQARKSSAASATSAEAPFAVFSRPAGPEDSKGNPFVERPSSVLRDLVPGSARRLRIASREVWAAQDAKFVCIRMVSTLDPGVIGGSCTPSSGAAETGVFAFLSPTPAVAKHNSVDESTVEAAGLLPDGVDSIELTFPDGSSKTLNIVDNGFSEVLPSGPKNVRFTDASGRVHSLHGGDEK